MVIVELIFLLMPSTIPNHIRIKLGQMRFSLMILVRKGCLLSDMLDCLYKMRLVIGTLQSLQEETKVSCLR